MGSYIKSLVALTDFSFKSDTARLCYPFVPNAPFLYPPENIRKPYGFLMFSVGREKVHWEQMG